MSQARPRDSSAMDFPAMAKAWLGEKPERMQADLERATGARQSTVSKWIRGERRPIKDEYVQGLADLFGRSYDEVAGAIKRTKMDPPKKSAKAQLADALAENAELRAELNRVRGHLPSER